MISSDVSTLELVLVFFIILMLDATFVEVDFRLRY